MNDEETILLGDAAQATLDNPAFASVIASRMNAHLEAILGSEDADMPSREADFAKFRCYENILNDLKTRAAMAEDVRRRRLAAETTDNEDI